MLRAHAGAREVRRTLPGRCLAWLSWAGIRVANAAAALQARAAACFFALDPVAFLALAPGFPALFALWTLLEAMKKCLLGSQCC